MAGHPAGKKSGTFRGLNRSGGKSIKGARKSFGAAGGGRGKVRRRSK